MRITTLLFLSVTFASANVMANDADADGVADKLDKCPNYLLILNTAWLLILNV